MSPVTPGLALALLVLAVVYYLTSNALRRHKTHHEGNGREIVAMTAKDKFRTGASATASVISGVLANIAAIAVPGSVQHTA
ncbi:hypothetical protein ACFWUU_09990 [Kribbella sp. NPDC058693]|uniref:hypothetical protein n=1 Tax=Kribbella sp. NPDC058693 TaxID=3346602 RepID=UPI003647C5DD